MEQQSTFNTPVLFIVFNRAETTRQVFEAIRQAKPKQLFVAADGPRPDKEGEKEKCEEVLKIATAVDWDCELKTLFREENIGCGKGPATAIDWFFENVEKGIILEDDCLPDPSFFLFCEELLEKYNDVDKVMQISGMNHFGKYKADSSYFFSNVGSTWGWATWRRAWKNYDYYLSDWNNENVVEKLSKSLKNTKQRESYFKTFEETYKMDNVSWWDYQWLYKRLMCEGISIVPAINIIKNIGWGENATHTFDIHSKYAKLKSFNIKFPLIHPEKIEKNGAYDEKVIESEYYYKPSLKGRVKEKIKSIFFNRK